MRLLSVQSVAKLIASIADRHGQAPGQAPFSPEYQVALRAVLQLVERHAQGLPEVGEALAKVRTAAGLQNANGADHQARTDQTSEQ